MGRDTLSNGYAKVTTNEIPTADVELAETIPVAAEVVGPAGFKVVAPCDLPAGFEFAVSIEGIVYQVRTNKTCRKGLKFVPEIVGEIDQDVHLPMAGGWRIPHCNLDSKHLPGAIYCSSCYMPTVLGQVFSRISRGQAQVPPIFYLYPIAILLVYLPSLMSGDPEALQSARAIMAPIGFIFWVHTCIVRGQVRRALAIDGDEVSDCAMSAPCCCIGACTVIQMDDQVARTTPRFPDVGLMQRDYVKMDIEQKATNTPVAQVL